VTEGATHRRVLAGTTSLKRPDAVFTQRRCRLLVIEGPDAGRSFAVDGPRIRAGKSSSCDLVLGDPAVSREHFVVERRGEEFVLCDLGSTNGTTLDGTRVREAYLHPGAAIRAGQTTLAFESADQPLDVDPVSADGFGDLLGRSRRMRQVFAALERLAQSDATVLLVGETGTGKGHAARALHQRSGRHEAPFMVFDCGAVSRTLIESELFGHEKGAFTGADQARGGALEAAGRGTLFIDELDELPLELQPKLLRALEERRFFRVGSNKPQEFRARIVAAAKRDLSAEVEAGRFRADLYFRVAVAVVAIPPLRARLDDLPLLISRLAAAGGGWDALPAAVRDRLVGHGWPGNVRELRNVMERLSLGMPAADALGAQVAATGGSAAADGATAGIYADLAPAIGWDLPYKEAKAQLLERFERRYLTGLLERHGGRVAPAAREAGLDRKYLAELLRRHQLPGAAQERDEEGSDD
jgi:DNA-binding NtrC family response regulator